MITRCFLFCALLFCVVPGTAPAVTIQGVNVPEQVTVNGQSLALNGAGLRTVTIAFIPIKAYVAGFYAPAPLRSEQDVLNSPGPLQFTFTFLQGVSQGQVTEAWNSQFAASATFSYPGFAADQAKFVGFFGPLSKGGIEAVSLIGDQTLVYDSGQIKGQIAGRNFQKAFLSLWFGSQPVMPSLKDALLGR